MGLSIGYFFYPKMEYASCCLIFTYVLVFVFHSVWNESELKHIGRFNRLRLKKRVNKISLKLGIFLIVYTDFVTKPIFFHIPDILPQKHLLSEEKHGFFTSESPTLLYFFKEIMYSGIFHGNC